MTDRPIIFSGPMVKALLDGRKTQTRRILKPQPQAHTVRPLGFVGSPSKYAFTLCSDGGANSTFYAPVRFDIGDRLWVRETFTRDDECQWRVAYRADGVCGAWCWDGDGRPMLLSHGKVLEASSEGQYGYARYGGKWRPSIHMPRWASRLTLIVTDVRVQRLWEISEEDAIAEGVEPFGDGAAFVRLSDAQTYSTVRGCFVALWESIHGKGAWARNDWVVAMAFDTVRQNIDSIERGTSAQNLSADIPPSAVGAPAVISAAGATFTTNR